MPITYRSFPSVSSQIADHFWEQFRFASVAGTGLANQLQAPWLWPFLYPSRGLPTHRTAYWLYYNETRAT